MKINIINQTNNKNLNFYLLALLNFHLFDMLNNINLIGELYAKGNLCG